MTEQAADQADWPTEIRLARDKRTLHVAFASGAAYALPAEYLRVESPSAEVQGHAPSERKWLPGKREVEILAVAPVGNYAVKLTFDDMHDTGIYAFDFLRRLGEEQATRFSRYEEELAARGLSREPARRR
ncbi:DUF971 domain-containing protein [Methylobacterium currus]|uniref:DUF971 domain-containing protein n=1 Tax=Methylobacterium currus TaxID=2051553 RepID=A0A2R4WE08_9HYPH|nr:DUF971 domain-containing protein [Methylobacterium currus]AWB19780.1 DUF971 domain-containing protein [Methylobacterium currus]UHC15505.1 DUF971 domain-containing protein [Methylobacterium currus]